MSSVAAPGLPPGLAPRAAARPRRQSTWPGFLAALAMHGALVGYLWFAVQWHTSAVAPAVAVLWDLPMPVDTVEPPPPAPQAPADTPPPPPPKEQIETPPKPDIVQEAERTKKKEEAPPPPKEPPPVKKEKPKPSPQPSAKELQRQAERQRAEEMARLASQAGVPGRTPVPAAIGRLSNEYMARVRAAVLANVHYAPPEQVLDAQYAEYAVTLIPSTGEIVGEPRLVHPSNLPGWDESVLRAILHTDPFPLQDDGKAPASLNLVFRPNDTR